MRVKYQYDNKTETLKLTFFNKDGKTVAFKTTVKDPVKAKQLLNKLRKEKDFEEKTNS